MRGAQLPLLLGLGLTLLPAAAHAHPFSSRYWSHQIHLTADPTTLTVDVELEVPTPFVLREFFAQLGGKEPTREQDEAFTAARLAALRESLTLTVNGGVLPLVDETPAARRNGVGNSNFFVYTARLTAGWAPVAGERYQVEVLDKGDLDREIYFRHTAEGKGGVEVLESSTWDPLTGKAPVGQEAWSSAPEARDLSVVLAVPSQRTLMMRGATAWLRVWGGWVGGGLLLAAGALVLRARRARVNPAR